MYLVRATNVFSDSLISLYTPFKCGYITYVSDVHMFFFKFLFHGTQINHQG